MSKVHHVMVGGAVAVLAVAGQASTMMTSHNIEVVPGEMLVRFKSGGAESFFQKQNLTGMYVDRNFSAAGNTIYVVKSSSGLMNTMSMADVLNNTPEVEIAEPNFIYSLIRPVEEMSVDKFFGQVADDTHPMTPNDPMFGKLWGMSNIGGLDAGGKPAVAGIDINALKAWEITKGLSSVKVAVIDTGIDYRHPDLARNIWINEAEQNGVEGVDDDGNGYVDDIHGYDFANNDGDPLDGHSHGTHCAGTIGAVHDNDIGVTGVVDNVTLVPIKFLTDTGSGTSEGAIRSIEYATKLNVDVMSNSWGGGAFSQLLNDVIQNASDAGIVFVAAAGNESNNNDATPSYPASYDVPNVLSIAALTAEGKLAYFSCYGKKSVDVAAPGFNIVSTVKNDGYKSYSGTSMATPHISGMIASLISHVGRLPHAEMRERLLATSVPVTAFKKKMVSGGRADLYNLLTDTRPDRHEPDPTKWVSVAMDEVFETEHPYTSNLEITKTIHVPGAEWLRLVIDQYDTETRFDYIEISDANGNVIEKISGKGDIFISEYVEGETLNIKFKSDRSVEKWGVLIDTYEVIMKE